MLTQAVMEIEAKAAPFAPTHFQKLPLQPKITVNSDGTLSAFSQIVGINLVTGRSMHSSVVLSNALYILGGVTTIESCVLP